MADNQAQSQLFGHSERKPTQGNPLGVYVCVCFNKKPNLSDGIKRT